MKTKKLKKTVVIYAGEDLHEYKTIYNKGRNYVKALFVNGWFDTFCIFEADKDIEGNHTLPEEVVIADNLDTAHKEWEELTYNYYTQN